MCGRLIKIIILCFFLCLIADFSAINGSCADSGSSSVTRNADYYNTQYGTTPFGGTWTIGQYGPDVGMGEQGYQYQYSDPLTGSFVSYSSSSMGMGIGGLFAGYNGMYSPLAQQSYGPYAYGNTPQVEPTPGWSTQGSSSGNAFGYSENYYQAQPAYGLIGGLLGGYYGGYSGYSLPSYGSSLYGSGLSSLYGSSLYSSSLYGSSLYGSSLYGSSPYGSSLYGSSLYGLGGYGSLI